MPAPYNPVGASGGLFAPAYLPNNPQSVAATTAYNAARQAQFHPTPPVTPPTTPPTGTPGTPGTPGFPGKLGRLGIFGDNPAEGRERFMQFMDSIRQAATPDPVANRARLMQFMQGGPGGNFTFTEPTAPPPTAPAGGGSYQFTEPPISPQPSAPAAPAPNVRNNITQALMQRRGNGV